jgi:large subunit ribosomal protein L28
MTSTAGIQGRLLRWYHSRLHGADRGRVARNYAGQISLSLHLTITQWSVPVASVCDVCGKGPGFGNNVSHSHRRTPRRWNPNIQRVRVLVGQTHRRLNVCTSCIKAGKVTR